MGVNDTTKFIGKYSIVRELGRGASSTVYLAEDPFNARKVAVKRIHPHLLHDERQAARYRKSMRNEALLAGQLRHPHIVSLHDADCESDPPYVVLEYVEGSPLAKFTRQDKLLPVEQVLDICYKVCSALDYAHTRGLVHRDIKPANIMLQASGDVKVMDLGTALVAGGESTQVAGFVGSPQYMSPEHVREEGCTWRSDMWSLGVVCYELLTGRRPFESESDFTTIFKIATEDPTLPSTLRPGLPPQIDKVLMRALAKHPEARFKQWMDFAESLLQINRGMTARTVRHREGDAFARMRALPFFTGFPDAVLWEALRLGTLAEKASGSVLMDEGEIGDSFMVLLQGHVAVLRDGYRVATLDPGVTLGEMAYLRRDEPRRTASVLSGSGVLVLEIRNEALRRASEDLQMCFDKAFIELLLQRLMRTTEALGKQAA